MPKFLTLPDRIVNIKSIEHVYKDVSEFNNPDDPAELGGAFLTKPAIVFQISALNLKMMISYGYEQEVMRDIDYEQIECALHTDIHLGPWKERRAIVSVIKTLIR